jgi:hypothetical protein
VRSTVTVGGCRSVLAFGDANRKSNQVTFDILIFLAAYIGLSTHWLAITGAIGIGLIIAELWRRMRRAPGDPVSLLLACSTRVVALLLSIFADLSADSGALRIGCPGWLTVCAGSIVVCVVNLALAVSRYLFRRTKRLSDQSGAANGGFAADSSPGAAARRRRL